MHRERERERDRDKEQEQQHQHSASLKASAASAVCDAAAQTEAVHDTHASDSGPVAVFSRQLSSPVPQLEAMEEQAESLAARFEASRRRLSQTGGVGSEEGAADGGQPMDLLSLHEQLALSVLPPPSLRSVFSSSGGRLEGSGTRRKE